MSVVILAVSVPLSWLGGVELRPRRRRDRQRVRAVPRPRAGAAPHRRGDAACRCASCSTGESSRAHLAWTVIATLGAWLVGHHLFADSPIIVRLAMGGGGARGGLRAHELAAPAQRMRIAFITGSLVHGGAERQAITLANRLAERGHDCHAVYVKNDPSQLSRLHLPPQSTVRCLHAARYFDPAALSHLHALLGRLDPDVVLATNPYALMYASLARRRRADRA